jgi:nitrite reductase/ring-hydroxylating ferredoxin subunit
MKQELCKLQDVPATGSVVVPFFGREVHVFRSGGRVRAAANVCLHFGGPLECKGGRLVCSWHNASFDMESGTRIDGPAPAGSRLLFLSTREEGGALFYVWAE